MADDRAAFLRGQLTGLECTARKMSREPVGFVDEVAAYFQVDVELGDPAEYARAHAELEQLLPGSGTLAERFAVHRRREECPPDRLEEAVQALSSALRDAVRLEYGQARRQPGRVDAQPGYWRRRGPTSTSCPQGHHRRVTAGQHARER